MDRPRGIKMFAIGTLVRTVLLTVLVVFGLFVAAMAESKDFAGLAGYFIIIVGAPFIGALGAIATLWGLIRLGRSAGLAYLALGFEIAALLSFLAGGAFLTADFGLSLLASTVATTLTFAALLVAAIGVARAARQDGSRISAGRAFAATIVALPVAPAAAILLLVASTAWGRR
jgi:hypothetical protein